MLDILKTYLTKGNNFYGLEVYQMAGKMKFHLLEVVKRKGELVIVDSKDFDNLQTLQGHAKIPMYLIYNKDDVITKTVGSQNNVEGKALVEQIFPGLNFENFYFQISKLKGNSYISIAKKENVQMFLERLKEVELKIIGFSMGICSLSNLADYVDGELLYTNTDALSWKKVSDPSQSISKKTNDSLFTYTINGLHVRNTELLAFSGILNFLTGAPAIASNFAEIITQLQNQYSNTRIFRILARSSLTFILIVLLSNFIFFNFYFEQVQLSKENLAFENESKKNLTTVRDRVSEKEKKVDAVLSFSNSRASFYLDKLGVSVPKSILLTELLYQPLTKPMRESKPIQLDENTILVMGTCISSEDFSSWITHLETMEWITSVETMDYDYKNKNISNFKIKISVSEF
ncbi:MAG: hypothetical protein ABJN84_03960 [Flavobacteriaceae bacterium]